MFSWFARMALFCLRPMRRYGRMNRDHDDVDDNDDHHDGGDSSSGDSLLWSRELERHSFGDFSIAVVQANEVLEDHCQVETGNGAVFVGVYDGHGGPEASRYISDQLFSHLMRISREKSSISEETLRAAFSATEEGFLTLVRRTCGLKPLIAAVGSCCLVGVIWKGTLLIANVGDSRAVLGSSNRSNKIVAEQLTSDHNAALEEVRQELRSLHPDDSHIVVLKHGVWRIKGIIQVSKSIGDAYLKRPEFSLDPSFPRFHLAERLQRPVLSAEPSVYTRVLQTSDKFVIFASDGLWEHMTNQQAVDIVNKNPRPGIARKLVRRAMNIAAKKREMSYDDLKKVERGVRRFFHDDITVVVIFIDNELLMVEKATVPELSIKGFSHTVGPSKFSIFFS
ncbi:PREDICTED: probable protein phosphatase 2C 68 isoform X1 [Camelina sativa]|uniref:protein-serine/threonine phosphatase n=1 Tax=Camelina sativa TaxID=90675 RepID=A0ABM0TAH2_CAMSA|nr:PREDICTED: probable protein phosphatase 2C 68 isoform X1 [Camelina sativa]